MPIEAVLRRWRSRDSGLESRHGVRAALASWARQNATDLLLVAGLLVLVGLAYGSGLTRYPARFDDEGAYVSQAWAVITRFDLSHYTYWYDHPPLGWILLGLYSLATGAFARARYGVAAGRELMLILNLLSLALLYVLARRLEMRRAFAAGAILLFGLSPLAIFFHRMVLLDNLGMPFLLLGLVLILSPRRHLGAHVGAAAALATAVLIKETFVLFVPFAAYLYWKRTEPPTRGYSIALTTTTFFGLVIQYPLFALLRGELMPSEDRVSLLGSITWQLFDRERSGSIFDPSSPANDVVSGWLGLDPFLLIWGLMASLAAIWIPRYRWIGWVILLLAGLLLRPGYLPVMYVVGALPFLALAVAGILDEAWRRASQSAGAGGPRFGRASGWVVRLLAMGSVLALVVGIWPRYSAGLATASNLDADRPFRRAQAWLADNLERSDVVLLDGALWLDVVQAGHPADQTIWYYKLDTDPEVSLSVPGGWRAVDYVVVTDIIRTTTYELPQVEAAIANSEPIMVFGSGENRVEIRAVDGE